jgi:acetylornithine/succinyldiaminopimelate/putrescine aminotransferase
MDVIPDVLVIAKAMGGGMPIGAFVADTNIMKCFTSQPALGHITTFGGHPVCCAAALASLQIIENNKLYHTVEKKSALFEYYLKGLDRIKEIRRKGLRLPLNSMTRILILKLFIIASKRTHCRLVSVL